MSDVEQLAQQLAEKLRAKLDSSQTRSPKEVYTEIAQMIAGAIRETPFQVIHHSPKDALNCPNCKPEYDVLLNEAREQGYRVGAVNARLDAIRKGAKE